MPPIVALRPQELQGRLGDKRGGVSSEPLWLCEVHLVLSPLVAGGQLKWVSLLDAGEGAAILTPVLRPRSHTSTLHSAGQPSLEVYA